MPKYFLIKAMVGIGESTICQERIKDCFD